MATKPRSIFQEVATTDKIVAAAPGAIDRGRRDARGAIRVWLMVLFALVVAMIAVGGLTRLTDSGLSITEWAPVTGAVPPAEGGASARRSTPAAGAGAAGPPGVPGCVNSLALHEQPLTNSLRNLNAVRNVE